MKEKIEVILKRLSELNIEPQSEFYQEYDNELMQQVAYIEYLTHLAYAAIENHYSQFTPNASQEEEFIFFKKTLEIKKVLRDLQDIHNDLTELLYEDKELYIYNEQEISLNSKYILPELKEKEPKEIVKANLYQLLDNISKNNSLSKDEFNYINSLFMQIASRPEGIKLIVKLNYLLTTKDVQLILKNSNNFECSMAAEGFAKINPDYTNQSTSSDFKTLFKKETVQGSGVKKVHVGVDYRYNDKISSLNLEVYASAGHGITDSGPAFILLAHELIHGTHNITGKARYNFVPFFQSPKYDDPLMQTLYPVQSLNSYGAAAEEYWTIEGGALCENALRKEHGFFNRTGHISAEPGSRAIQDLYHIGLARSYRSEHMELLQNYLRIAETIEGISDKDKMIEHLLCVEKYKSINYSLTDLMNLSKNLTSFQLRKINKLMQNWQDPMNDMHDSDKMLQDFLMNVTPKIAQLLMAVTKNKEIDYDAETDAALIKDRLPAIQQLNTMLKQSGLPEHILTAFEEFTENMETKSAQLNLTL